MVYIPIDIQILIYIISKHKNLKGRGREKIDGHLPPQLNKFLCTAMNLKVLRHSIYVGWNIFYGNGFF